ncbi:MAG: N-acetylneuraminate synthase family protein [Leptospira sp.]|nr:N-acetylneuraminate synthase family protein [Leptospira sp.]
MFNENFQLTDSIKIGRHEKPFVVAEIGLNHNNDADLGKRIIKEAKRAGVSAVKFQSYITEEFIDQNNPEARFLFDIFKNYELSEQLHRDFQKTAHDEGLIFFSTPLCSSSIDMLVSMNVPVLKIASGDIVNSELLGKCAATGLPLFLSTGAANLSEITRALEFLQLNKTENLCLLHCVSMYPAPTESLNLKTIELLKELTRGPVGFSDHSSESLGATIAVSYDACVIEKHFTLDKNLPGPDHSISADPSEMKDLVEKCNQAYLAKGEKLKINSKSEIESRYFGRRSLYLSEKTKLISLRPNKNFRDLHFPEAWEFERFKDLANKFRTDMKGKPLGYSDIPPGE